jgi:hypothetical protein
MSNIFNTYTDADLINLWNNTPPNSSERLNIYKEFIKRNKLFLLDEQSNYKIYNNEYVCGKFKLGFLSLLGSSSSIGIIIQILFFSCFFLFFLFLYVISESQITYFRFINKNFVDKSVISCLIFIFLYMLNFFCFKTYILVTNKSIIICKNFFHLINFNIRKITINKSFFTNKILGISDFFFIRFMLIVFSKECKKFYFFIRLSYATIFYEWIELLSESKCYFLNISNFIKNNENNCFKYYNLVDYYSFTSKIHQDLILKACKNKFEYFNIYNLVNYLKCKTNNTQIELKYQEFKLNFLLDNEYIIFVFKITPFSLIKKNLLLITNFRIIIITQKNFIYINSFYLSDKNLDLVPNIFGINILYKNKILDLILWKEINVPFLDFLDSVRS